MVSISDLTGQASGPPTFNWPWFIELCVCGILVLFFLFYFNRLFATLLSYGIRAYAWHHYRIWVDIQALQLSFLGGRIFFKGVRYHGENETVFVHNGYITWRYWLRNVRQVDLTIDENSARREEHDTPPENDSDTSSGTPDDLEEGKAALKKQSSSEARIAVSVTGLEWFVYNRTPVYDSILRECAEGKQDQEHPGDSGTGATSSEGLKIHLRSKLRRRPKSAETSTSDDSKFSTAKSEVSEPAEDEAPEALDRRSTTTTELTSAEADITVLQSLFIQLLPVYIECSKGAFSIGNEHTKALMVMTFDKAKGHVDARGCGPNDLFQQVFDFDAEHPVIQMRPNPDYVGTQTTVAERVITESVPLSTKRHWWQWNLHLARRRYKAIHALRSMVPGLQSSVESLRHEKYRKKHRVSHNPFTEAYSDGEDWHGLGRYMDENDDDDHQAWTYIDYARFSTIVDCPSVRVIFYWDSPGRVKAEHIEAGRIADLDDINGIKPPAYGMDIVVRGGTINYGPWSDRLRAEIQQVFFPASFKSPVPAKPLKVGQWRLSTAMVIRVEIEEEVTMRVPTRESSKDWRWRGRVTAVRDAAANRKQRQKRHFRLRRGPKSLLGPDIRSFGWIAFSVSQGSSVRYDMDMVAGQHGYRNLLQLDLKNTKATSSVNHADLWRCTSQTIRCDLSNPLIWNSLHTWHFHVESQSMDMFILRDHMFLLTDLIADFTAGVKANYMTFVPFEYKLDMHFDDLKMYLNANDFNIIDNPCDLDSNTFLVMGLRELEGKVDIPMKYFSAPQNSVVFHSRGNDLFLDLKTPVWHTLHSFAKENTMFTLKSLGMHGSYNYYAGTSPELTDSLFMNIVGKSPRYFAQGFLIRYFMNVKENYFGDDLHFRTLEEYQSQLGPGNRFTAEGQRRPTKKDNDLDVILNVRAENSCMLMPANLYVREENVRVDVMLVEADMRFTNYYMDLQVSSSPIEVSLETNRMENGRLDKRVTECQLYIDSVAVYGHRLFGAPPTEPTYVCNWDFDTGSIYGECSARFLEVMLGAVQSLIFTLKDDENALPATRDTQLNDITFVRSRTAEVQVWVVTEHAAFLTKIGRTSVTFNDWAGQHFSKNLRASIPSITVAAIDLQGSGSRQERLRRQMPTLACFQTSVYIVNTDRKAEFEYQRQLQQTHVKFHDLRTNRAVCLLHDDRPLNIPAKEIQWSKNPPAMPVPDLASPLLDSSKTNNGAARTSSRARLRHQKSFLSSYTGDSAQIRTTSSVASSTMRESPMMRYGVQRESESSRDRYRAASQDQRAGHKPTAKDTSFASPWVEPHFTLRSVKLDLDCMPTIDVVLDGYANLKDRGADQEYADSNENLTHAAVFCDLRDGLRGFCTPLVIPPIVDLLQKIMPKDPQSLLDAVQRSTVANIKDLYTEEVGEKVDFAFKIPAAAIRLISSDPNSKRLDRPHVDQYDLILSKVRLNGRLAPTVTKQTHGQTSENIFLLQASVQEIETYVTEVTKSDNTDGAKLHLLIRDIGFWVSLQDSVRTKLQLGLIRAATGGSTVDRLSSLIERTRIMVTKIISDFEDFDPAYATRHLVYHLSLMHAQTADPTFLSKPSYVLRSAPEHVRSADSWKVVSRFRQRLLSQSPEEQRDLVEHQSCMFERQEAKAQRQIMESIDHWKTWDRNDEACGPLIAAIFGGSSKKGRTFVKVTDIEAGLYMNHISIVLDPGPQQNELVLYSGDLNFSQKPVFQQTAGRGPQDLVRKSKMRAQLWFSSITLDLNWNLVHLAESLIKQINISTAQSRTDGKPLVGANTAERRSDPEPKAEELDLVFVLGTDIASMKMRTINLNLYMAAHELKNSMVVERSKGDFRASLLVASTFAQLKLASRYKRLFNWKLKSPNVYGLYQQSQHKLDGSDTARFAASCDRLRFDMKEDILSILEIVDTVIRDEVVTIQSITDSIEQRTAATKPASKSSSLTIEDVHMAFFLDNYKLQLCLLPSLYYIINGVVARTSIVPRPQSQYVIHVDIKQNTHSLIEPSKYRRSTAAALKIPPIGGRLLIGVNDQRISVSARSTLEQVTIEAAAVQACVEAIYRPRNIERLKDGKLILQKIQRSIKGLTDHPARNQSVTQPSPKPSKTLFYHGQAVFEGFTIRCSAPGITDRAHQAEVTLGLRQTTLRIHNHRRAKKVALDRPQFEVKLRQVFMALSRRSGSAVNDCGSFGMGLKFTGVTQISKDGEQTQNYRLRSGSTKLDLFTETASVVTDMAAFLQGRIEELTTIEELQKIRPLRRLTLVASETKHLPTATTTDDSGSIRSLNIFDTTILLDLHAIVVRWIVAEDAHTGFGRVPEDLVFSVRQIELRTQRESSARLTILDTQLQTVPKKQKDPVVRTANSALLPEMIFNAAHFSTKQDRRFAFQAAGKALDLTLAADGILPLSTIQRSLARAAVDLRNAKTTQTAATASPSTETSPATNLMGNKRLASLLVDADFAGAVFKITPLAETLEPYSVASPATSRNKRRSRAGRYGQAVHGDGAEEAILRAPGIAVKVEYIDTNNNEPALSTEIKVAASSNTLAPSVVPLVLEIYSSIKEIIGDDSPEEPKTDIKLPAQRYITEAASTETDPTAILGRVKLNAGLWVQRQEFSLTCQPIARVAATTRFEEILVTINTVHDNNQERFFSIITTFNKLQASVQHVYSRESTASFEVDSIVMSLMNSKHVSAKNGISAILNISPMRASLNAKQMQDFLLFREIWYPTELRQPSKPPAPTPTVSDSQVYAMQRYHELAATAALPWHAVVSIHELTVQVDFGQSLGKSSFMISKLWASSKKNSDWEQNLCFGFNRIGIDSSGRMSGFIELNDFRARTSIRWPVTENSDVRAPLVQASVGFGHLRLKAAFDYQPFAVADVSTFDFLMYNVRPGKDYSHDRLVGILNGGKVQMFCISTAAAQTLSIVQAFERLFQEKRDAFQDSLHELDRLLRRKSVFPTSTAATESVEEHESVGEVERHASHLLHTDVVVTLKAVDVGVFPNTFFDAQILKVEAVDAQARFAVATIDGRLRNVLGMKLGQVRVALSTVGRANTKALGEVEIGEVIERATASRGGTILKVPRLVAKMQTWQASRSSIVEYIFRSTFQGKVDVGWNYSRIRFIRGMWDTHSQALVHRLGKPLPPAAVTITAEPQGDGPEEPGQEKITAVVNMPQSSKFQYVALEPPIIDTPQLRDMGEATPPLEWIGLHRDKLPNVTHSIIIVTLLEVAKEVEDAYTRILGTG